MQNIANIPGICSLFNISQAIISPGSRNAPLIFSFTSSNKIKCSSIVDERSAAYFALGIAQKSNKPVIIICTSGTAVLNYSSAIAEAYYQGLPLIVITADRPPELIDQNDGQTIRQVNVFENYIKGSYNLPIETDSSYSDRIVYEALQNATSNRKGPVHINVPLREPLYEKLPKIKLSRNFQEPIYSENTISKSKVDSLKSIWKDSAKKLIICGFNNSPEYSDVVIELAKRKDTVVLAENIANVNSERIINNLDPIFHIADNNFVPDLIITIGNSIVSKRLKIFLKNNPVSEHWHIHESNLAIDTFGKLTKTINTNPRSLLKKLSVVPESKTDYFEIYKRAQAKIIKFNNALKCDFSDLKAFDIILKHVPSNNDLHLSNSTSIRYSQFFEVKNSIQYFSNRGTSGIDGCTSTALGSAYYSKNRTTIITGDIAFLYDSNALWNEYIQKSKLKIIVLNNNGGNIFNLIQSSKEFDEAEAFFTTPQNIKIEQLAKAYDIPYFKASDVETLNNSLELLFNTPNASILEINTNPEINTKTYKEYFQLLKQ